MGGFVPGAGQTYDAGMNYGPSASEAAGFNPAGGGNQSPYGQGGSASADYYGNAACWLRGKTGSQGADKLQLKGLFKFRNLTTTYLIEQILECNL